MLPVKWDGWPRIIPADAGSTRDRIMVMQIPRDHPRGCGEHQELSNVIGGPEGSSPRMRGAHETIVSRILIIRIIPADAGSTCHWPTKSANRRDHPRGCGEH